jgi:hypothetical protein
MERYRGVPHWPHARAAGHWCDCARGRGGLPRAGHHLGGRRVQGRRVREADRRPPRCRQGTEGRNEHPAAAHCSPGSPPGRPGADWWDIPARGTALLLEPISRISALWWAAPDRVGPQAALADRQPTSVNALPTVTLPGGAVGAGYRKSGVKVDFPSQKPGERSQGQGGSLGDGGQLGHRGLAVLRLSSPRAPAF